MRVTRDCHGLSCACQAVPAGLQRRNVLRAAVGGLFATAAFVRAAEAQSVLTPDQASKALMDGNARFVAKQLTSFQQDLTVLKQNTVEKQEPFAAVLSCANSRVPVELVFDQSIGHLFVTRVAGNVATAETIASLEYGAAVLGVKTILVLAHSDCGAVKATMAGKPVPGQISTLYRLIYPAVQHANGDLATAAKENARNQAVLLRDASPVLGGLIRDGKLGIDFGVLRSGQRARDPFEPVNAGLA